ncbi:MAG: transposase [Planctomycetes bacterium]|nr:transposase [Planctomycetota bacterium]
MTIHEITNEMDVLILAKAAEMHQDLYALIELLNQEIKILKDVIKKRPKLSAVQKKIIARLSQGIERKILELSEHIVTVDSLRRWYRDLIAKTYTGNKTGRPRVSEEHEKLICELALDNPHWGAASIHDRLKILHINICCTTIANILKRNGILPAPEREKTNKWQSFLAAHWPSLYALDFATFEMPGPTGKRTNRIYALYAIKISTREVKLLGITESADSNWCTQIARNECHEDGFFNDATAIIMDNDPMFRGSFRAVFSSQDIELPTLPSKSPNLNAFMERFIGTMRREVGRNFIPFNVEILHQRLLQHVAYYNLERPHQGLGNALIPDSVKYDATADNAGKIKRSSRLGKTLNYYYREAI